MLCRKRIGRHARRNGRLGRRKSRGCRPGQRLRTFGIVQQERADTDSYSGNNRRSAEVVADNIYFGDSKRDSQSGGDYAPPAYGSPAESYTAPASGGFAEIEEDGELPF